MPAVALNVTMLAMTELADEFPDSVIGSPFVDRTVALPVETDPDLLAEFAGRSCYQSWTLPTPETAHNSGYLANILDQRHYSVLEHASVTVYIEGVSRSFTHELVRHRMMSYSQLSQRFVDESDANYVIPPALRGNVELEAQLKQSWTRSLAEYASIAEKLMAGGLPRKKAREAARSVLPNCTETRIVVTGNLRAWRELLEKRLSPGADAEMREFAAVMLELLRRVAPASVQDFR
jgi:thymidylate synthase (FAD)